MRMRGQQLKAFERKVWVAFALVGAAGFGLVLLDGFLRK